MVQPMSTDVVRKRLLTTDGAPCLPCGADAPCTAAMSLPWRTKRGMSRMHCEIMSETTGAALPRSAITLSNGRSVAAAWNHSALETNSAPIAKP